MSSSIGHPLSHFLVKQTPPSLARAAMGQVAYPRVVTFEVRERRIVGVEE